MHPREHFVGTIWDNRLLLRFIGEGADHVVFQTGDPATGLPDGMVMKFRKPLAFLEMDALHHAFTVSERWPEHPFRQTEAERAATLLSEMLARVRSDGFVRRVEFMARAYTGALHRLVQHTSYTMRSRGNTGGGATECIAEIVGERMRVDLGLVRLLDRHFVSVVEEQLDADVLGDDVREILGVVAELAPAMARSDTVAVNPLCNLLGLYCERFINESELADIAKTRLFKELLRLEHMWTLCDALRIWYCMFYHRGINFERLKAKGGPDFVIQRERFELDHLVRLLHLGVRLAAGFADGFATLEESLRARIRAWRADVRRIADSCIGANDPAFTIWDPHRVEAVAAALGGG